jgi:hypothetical protein
LACRGLFSEAGSIGESRSRPLVGRLQLTHPMMFSISDEISAPEISDWQRAYFAVTAAEAYFSRSSSKPLTQEQVLPFYIGKSFISQKLRAHARSISHASHFRYIENYFCNAMYAQNVTSGKIDAENSSSP